MSTASQSAVESPTDLAQLPLVAIVGRPNVGKSTLFNRLAADRHAIVDDQSGITRDRVYAQSHWAGTEFNVVDTGGYVPSDEERFSAAIREQVDIAIEEADAILFVVDVTTGITDLDSAVAERLRKSKKPVFVVANKADDPNRRMDAPEFYGLGLGEVFPVSAINGSGTGEVLDALVDALPDSEPASSGEEPLRIALIGRQNVGKSSLTNMLVGKQRSIVTDVAGTTRDAVDSTIEFQGKRLVLVDTAGLRRKARIKENVEFYSALRTERAIQRADVCVLLIDARSGLEAQDMRVLRQAEDMRKGLVLAVNKWDLVEKDSNTAKGVERELREKLKMMDYIPIFFISALTGKRATRVLEASIGVAERRARRIPTSELNDTILPLLERHRPPAHRGVPVRIKFASQVRIAPPVFAFYCNYPQSIRDPYRRYVENQLRKHYDFAGVPLTLRFRRK